MGWMGGVAGACTGATIGQAGITNSYGVNAGVTVAAGGVVGGTLTAMAGGNFWEGFAYGAAGSAAALALGAAYGNGENENAQRGSGSYDKMKFDMMVAGDGAPSSNGYIIEDVEITHYCNCKICTGKSPGDPAYGIAKDGTVAESGTVAADPRKIPMGSEIYFRYPDGTVFNGVVHEIGGGVKGYHIDVWMPSHNSALTGGRLQGPIRVIPPGR